MKIAVVIAFLCLLGLSIAIPLKPLWPKAFAASVAIQKSDDPMPGFFRWFWDEAQNKDRIDGLVTFQGERYFAEIIFDHPNGREYNIFYQGGLVVCLMNKINTTIPKPNFDNMEFIGKAIVGFEAANHWFVEDRAKGFTFQIYDSQATRRVLRFDIDDGRRHRAESWTFFEFDEGPQSKELFEIPSAIKSQCTQ